MKKQLRTVHIDGQKWKWIVESLRGYEIKEIRIYSPEKKLFRVRPEDVSTIKSYEEYGGDAIYTIQPHMIKNYIETKILKTVS